MNHKQTIILNGICAAIAAFLIGALLCATLLGGRAKADDSFFRTQRQIAMHDIAETARAAGLSEEHPIIQEAKRLWLEDSGQEDNIRMGSRLCYNEAGNGCTEEHQLLVVRTAMNRTVDGRFGGTTLYDVLIAPKQYLPAYANYSSTYNVPQDRLVYFEDIARRAIKGEPFDCPVNVLYQDNQKHGTGVYKSFYSTLLNSTTYFCYG